MVTFIDEWRRKFPSCMVVKRLNRYPRKEGIALDITKESVPTSLIELQKYYFQEMIFKIFNYNWKTVLDVICTILIEPWI